MTTAERMKRRRKELGLSAEYVADRLGCSPTTVYRYEKGDIEKMPLDILKPLSTILCTSPAYLMGWDEDAPSTPGILPLPANRSYPLLGNIACGTPILAEQNITEYIQFPGDINADFCLRCQGDSMIEARIHDGDIVFIRQQPEVANGEIAAVQIGSDTATLKRVYRSEDGTTLTLMAVNPAYPPMVYAAEQLASVRILGKAIHFLSTVK